MCICVLIATEDVFESPDWFLKNCFQNLSHAVSVSLYFKTPGKSEVRMSVNVRESGTENVYRRVYFMSLRQTGASGRGSALPYRCHHSRAIPV